MKRSDIIEEEEAIIAKIKRMRTELESRIQSQHNIQIHLLSSLQRTLIPNFVHSVDQSLKIISLFNQNRPFSPTSIPHQNHNVKFRDLSQKILNPKPSAATLNEEFDDDDSEKFTIGRRHESGWNNPLMVVRSMVAVCLLQRVPFVEIDSSTVLRKIENDDDRTMAVKAAFRQVGGELGAIFAVETALKSMAEDNVGVELEDFVLGGSMLSRTMVVSIDRSRLLQELPAECWSQLPHFGSNDGGANAGGTYGPPGPRGVVVPMNGSEEYELVKEVEALISKKSHKEKLMTKTGEEILELINRPTHRENTKAAEFKTKGGSRVKERCVYVTKEICRHKSGSYNACEKVHFRRIVASHTDVGLGDCNYLDTCRHMKTCKYVHYELDVSVPPMMMLGPGKPLRLPADQRAEYCSPQWINCDIRNFRMDILGQFEVIMADPPWDIHMELPYGTMPDDEMRTLNVPALQTDGLIFLWVTGRAMELGRECLQLWGYKCVEEIVWVKTNQLERIIRTGRTGHWLNHSKEHCLVGIKGNPQVNRNIDTDVIVAEVRETSRKPDEMYPLLERLSPRTRKLELFARTHNTMSGWISLGNQLPGVRLVDDGLRARFKAAYPEVAVEPAFPP